MSDSGSDGTNSARRGANSTRDSTDERVEGDLPIREFLYLDVPKLTSYFAQISEGLPTRTQDLLGYRERELARDTEYETTGKGEGGVSLGESDLGASISRLVGLVARLEAQVSRVARSGGDEHELANARYQVETKEVHHEIFDQVERFLLKHALLAKGDEEPARPFRSITGKAELIDFDQLSGMVRGFPKLGKNFSTVTKQNDFSKTLKHPNELAAMIDTFYSGRLGLVVHRQGFAASAYLQHDHLTASFQQIADNYGRHTQAEVTLFGLYVGSAYPADETSGEAVFSGEDAASEGGPTPVVWSS